VPICLCSYLDPSFVIVSIFNGLLPFANVSLLGNYAFGSGNSKQEILFPHSWEVTGICNCATLVNLQLKDLVKLLSWRCKTKRYWTSWETSEPGLADFQISTNNSTWEVDGQHFENRIKSQGTEVSDSFNCEITFTMEIDKLIVTIISLK